MSSPAPFKIYPMKLFLSIISLLLLSGISQSLFSQIVITHRDLDDGSKKLTKSDSSHILPFSIENYGKSMEYNSKEDINFELINSQQLKQICGKNVYTWVFIQSSWCGACN
jgi:hypothetical protein